MKKITYLLLLLTTFSFAQEFSEFKYASIPSKFSFSREVNQYNLNVLTKMFIEQLGFEAYFDNQDLPKDFIENNCNKIYVDVLENNNMFSTKLTVVLKDCHSKILFTSKEGVSKEKEFNTSYNLALREALNSMKSIRNSYKEIASTESNESSSSNSVSEIKPIENTISSSLFAQPISNGFQLINSSPKVIYKIYKTTNNQIYIANKENLNGVLISKNNEWFFEYYQNDKLISEKVEVKF